MRLELDAEAVDDSVDVREVGGDLVRLQDRLVVEAGVSHRLEVARLHRGGSLREAKGVAKHRTLAVGGQGRRAGLVIASRKSFESVEKGAESGIVETFYAELSGQTGPMVLHSVMAAIARGHRDAEDLTLPAAELAGLMHHGSIQS